MSLVLVGFTGVVTNAVVTATPASATTGTDDYPNTAPKYLATAAQDSVVDPWGFYNRECVSFVAWRLNNDNGMAFTNNMSANGVKGHFGVASEWKQNAINLFGDSAFSGTPAIGSVAWWDANHGDAGSMGHVAYVDSVNANGSINIEQYNTYHNVGGYWAETIATTSKNWPSGFLHLKDGVATPPPPPGIPTSATSSSDDSEYSGDFNGDGYSDIATLSQLADGGIGVHLLHGGSGATMFSTVVSARSLYGSAPPPGQSGGFNWNQIKVVAGRFNSDTYADLAILHQTADGGFHLYVLYGGPTGTEFTAMSDPMSFPASDGWNWANAKVVSGDFKGNGFDDIAIAEKRADGGADIHVLYGGAGTDMFSYNNALPVARSLPGPGWQWSHMKLAAGLFNADSFADLVVFYQASDGGVNVHILYGANDSSAFSIEQDVRDLPGTAGWDWTKMKLAAGLFNSDPYADLAILHQTSAGGIDIHVLYGGAGTSIFSNTTTIAQHLLASDGWVWTQTMITSGLFNADSESDLALLTQLADGGIGIHVAYGGVGTPFQTVNPVTTLPGSQGWSWTATKFG
ncbi:CHAP domain-containing protein [Kitasatospora sp. NPDC088391]|uniref:CHAP domain-containing protein n=1 Tax=Kitasatospora sp. NPDC088391 TaxID=3364074 RepID=UPI0038284DE5